jgi:hypothetical protein
MIRQGELNKKKNYGENSSTAADLSHKLLALCCNVQNISFKKVP